MASCELGPGLLCPARDRPLAGRDADHREPGCRRSQYSGVDDPTPELRTRVLAGDAEAFGEVFDVCARSVYNHAFRLTGDWSAAEDVMAMTFLEAWRGRARLVPDGGSLRHGCWALRSTWLAASTRLPDASTVR
jgi:hypothetical protein